MLALSIEPAQVLIGIGVGIVAFLLAWFLLGTAARQKQDRDREARMRAVIQPGQQAGPATSASTPQAGGWIPDNVSKFGTRFAESRGFSERLDAELEAAGVSLRSGEFVVASAVACLVFGVLGAALLRNWILALVLAGVGAAFPTVLLRSALSKRADRLREQLPDVLTIMASSLRAGHSFLQSLDTVAKEIAHPAAAEFQRVVAEIRLGRPAEDALESLAVRVGSPDFKWAVLAVNIQREVGGNLAEILDTVADTLRERAMLRRQIKVLTAEGRLSAWVLGLLPFGIALYMFAVNPSYIGLLFHSTYGIIMLIVAGCLLVAGVLWMKKIVDIDV
ncbi:MAG TPA: type II secretion system F family protein [Actinomycetota bacterium]|jgi:tight adherence protein B|nr:type II secretion system F family protein [Actinomycetota bacterium]